MAEPTHRGYPVSLRLSGRHCLVVGGGEIARRKIEDLLAAGALVTVVAPKIDPVIRSLGVKIEERPYARGEAALYQLVLTTTGLAEVDEVVFSDADSAGIFANSQDDPANCSFTAPAIARVGQISIAISTDGNSPALASYLRNALLEQLPEHLEDIAETLFRTRGELRGAKIPTEGLDWQGLISQLIAGAGDAAHLAQVAGAFVVAARQNQRLGAEGRGSLQLFGE
jgi:siroheme synthase-like protein